jgi:hypothetical protein
MIERHLAAPALILQRSDVRWQQSMQCVCVAFCLGKGRSFVEPWIVQEIKSRKMRAKGGLPGIKEGG